MGLANTGQPENKPLLALSSRTGPGTRRRGKLGRPAIDVNGSGARWPAGSRGKGVPERGCLCPGPWQPGQGAQRCLACTPWWWRGNWALRAVRVLGCWRFGTVSDGKSRLAFCWTASLSSWVKDLIWNCSQAQDCAWGLFVPPLKCLGLCGPEVCPWLGAEFEGSVTMDSAARRCLIHLVETTWTSRLNYCEKQQTRASLPCSLR